MPPRSARQPAVGFIFVTLILIVLGFGIIIPVLPGLVTEFEGGSAVGGAHSFGWLVGSFALMQFIAAPVLGALSDRFGRRRVILIALAGSAIDYVVMGLAPTLGWLFVARIIVGLTASALATCNAYIADVTPPEKRTQGFGLVGAAFGIGFVLGPVLGGFLGSINLRLPFFVAAGCVGVNWLYGAFVLPGPAAQTLITRRVPADEQGTVQGALASLASLAGVFAPPIGAWSFAACIAPEARLQLPGIAFFEAAALSLAALALAARAVRAEAPVVSARV